MAIYNNSAGAITVSGGTVSATSGIAIYNNSTGTVTVSGGTVSATSGRAILNNSTGTVAVSGGTVSATNGIAIVNNSTGKITVSQATEKTTLITSENTNANFGTIFLENSGTATDVRLEITGGTVQNTSTGIAIYNNSAGAVTVSSGTVSATGTGGIAIYNNSAGAITVSGSTVSATDFGYAIWNASTGAVTVSSGTVSATGTGGYAIASTGTVAVSGGTVSATDFGYAIFNNSTSAVTISGGTVSATSGTAICNASTGAVTVSRGEVKTTSGSAIYNTQTGAVTVSGGEVSATTGTAINNASRGAVTVSGGTVSATTGTAIENNSTGKTTVSGTATVTSANTLSNRGTIILVGGTAGTEVLLITGGKVQNTSSGNAIYINSAGTVTVSGGSVSTVSGDYAIFSNSAANIRITAGTVSSSNYAIGWTNTNGTISLGGNPEIIGKIWYAAGKLSVITTETADKFNPQSGRVYSLELSDTLSNGLVAVAGGKDYLNYFTLANTGYDLAAGTGANEADLVIIAVYTVSFNLNGGMGTKPGNATVNHGSTVLTKPTEPDSPNNWTKAGYTHDGKWYTRTGAGTEGSPYIYTEFKFGASGTGTAVTTAVTLYLQWTLNTYTVSGVADGTGYIMTGNASVTHGTAYSFTVTPATGYNITAVTVTVGGVAVTPTNSGTTYTIAAASVTGNIVISVTASLNSYTVSGVANGTGYTVSGNAASIAHNGSYTFTVTAATGYDISTLSVTATGTYGTISISGGNITISNVTTAITVSITISKFSYTITYNQGTNGTGSSDTSTKTYGDALTLKGAIFARSGYIQGGWATSDGGAKAYDLSGSYTNNSAVTLYPVWTLSAPLVGSVSSNISKTYDAATSTLSVTVTGISGITLSYQWYKSDGSGYQAISGKTSSSLALRYVADSGSYKVIITATDGTQTQTTEQLFTVTISKASYTGITHEGLSATYTATNTLANVTGLSEHYSWVTPSTKLTVAVSSYAAKYNADTANYNDFEFNITVTVAKATYSGITHDALSATYTATNTLANVTGLSEHYSWVTSSTKLTIAVSSYAAIYNADTANYNDFALNITVTVAKATYSGITHDALSATYTATNTLADLTLSQYYSWVTSSTKLTAAVSSYAAKYNADTANYNDFEFNITVTVAKATYSGITHDALSATYTATNTLANVTGLSEHYSWVTPSTKLTAAVSSYAAKYNADTANYNDFALNITVTVAKATYSGITHDTLSATYTATNTLADLTLSQYYSWVTPSTKLTVAVSSYAAKYNADTANYNDFEFNITVNVAKGTYTGITHDALSATYTATNTLADLTLSQYYSWVTPSTKLTVAVSSYAAKYNADTANYNDFEFNITVNVAKGSQTSPSLSMSIHTQTSITLTAVTGAEYSRDGTTWVDSNVFGGLEASTQYTFYIRIKGTANLNASASISANFSTTGEITGKTDDDAPEILDGLIEGIFDEYVPGTDLPAPDAPDGFEFGGWKDKDGNVVSTVDTLDDSTELTAIWGLETPVVTIKSEVSDSGKILTAEHDNHTGIAYTYQWYIKSGSSGNTSLMAFAAGDGWTLVDGATMKTLLVTGSGEYKCEVAALSGNLIATGSVASIIEIPVLGGEPATSLTWLIVLLAIIIILEAGFAALCFYLTRKNKKGSVKTYSFAAMPVILAAAGPAGAVPVLIIEIAIIIGLAVWIALMFKQNPQLARQLKETANHTGKQIKGVIGKFKKKDSAAGGNQSIATSENVPQTALDTKKEEAEVNDDIAEEELLKEIENSNEEE